jgi:hypothetical protein
LVSTKSVWASKLTLLSLLNRLMLSPFLVCMRSNSPVVMALPALRSSTTTLKSISSRYGQPLRLAPVVRVLLHDRLVPARKVSSTNGPVPTGWEALGRVGVYGGEPDGRGHERALRREGVVERDPGSLHRVLDGQVVDLRRRRDVRDGGAEEKRFLDPLAVGEDGVGVQRRPVGEGDAGRSSSSKSCSRRCG